MSKYINKKSYKIINNKLDKLLTNRLKNLGFVDLGDDSCIANILHIKMSLIAVKEECEDALHDINMILAGENLYE